MAAQHTVFSGLVPFSPQGPRGRRDHQDLQVPQAPKVTRARQGRRARQGLPVRTTPNLSLAPEGGDWAFSPAWAGKASHIPLILLG